MSSYYKNSTVFFLASLSCGVLLSYIVLTIFGKYIEYSYMNLLILYIGSTIFFGLAGLILWNKFNNFAFSLPLFIIAFCWFSIYVAQRFADVEIFTEAKTRAELIRTQTEKKDAKRPAVAQSLIDQGKNQFKDKIYNKAIETFSAAISFDTTLAEPYFLIGDVYKEQKFLDQASKSYLLGLKKDSNRPDIHLKVGIINMQMGEVNNAYLAYKVAVEMDSSSGRAQEGYFVAEMEKTKIEEEVKKGKLRIQQIVLNSMDDAKRVLETIREGANFGAVAFRYSIDEVTKSNGGLTSFFDPNKNEHFLIDEIKKMKVGDFSEIHEYQDMFFIIKRVN
ncbi:peptidylprolyl isomerase [candidate division KSB1 bacterium]